MSQLQGLILNWSGSVNQSLSELTGGLTTDIVYAHNNANNRSKISIFEAEAYALYEALTAAAPDGPEWSVVSASSYDHNTNAWGLNSAGWSTIDEVRMPMSMSLNDSIVENYTPTPHSWVTLKYVEAGNKETYLTIDCRYPTPPHLSSIKYDTTENATSKGINLKRIYNTAANADKLFMVIGPSSVQQINYGDLDRGSDDRNMYDPTLTVNGTEYKPHISCSFDDFKGIAVRDTARTTPFETWDSQGTPSIIYHDYPSRVVGFIDLIVSNKAPVFTVNRYGTISTRPKFGADGDESIIHCWGLDYIRNGAGISSTIEKADKYKFHINWVGGSPVFMFGISKNTNTNASAKKDFISLYGISRAENRASSDEYFYVPTAINCDISRDTNRSDLVKDWYSLDYSYCLNNNGNVIEYIADSVVPTSKISVENNTINNYFNTCFRNYNFKEDETASLTIRKGASKFVYPYFGDIEGRPSALPAFAPLNPSDSSVCSLALRSPQALMNSSNTGYKVLGTPAGAVYQEFDLQQNGTKLYWWTLQSASIQDVGYTGKETALKLKDLMSTFTNTGDYYQTGDTSTDYTLALYKAAGSSNFPAVSRDIQKGIHLNGIMTGLATTLKTNTGSKLAIKGLFPYHYLEDGIKPNDYGYTPGVNAEFQSRTTLNLSESLQNLDQTAADNIISAWVARFNPSNSNTLSLQRVTNYLLSLTASNPPKFGYEESSTNTHLLTSTTAQYATNIGVWVGFKFTTNNTINPKFSYRTSIPIPYLVSVDTGNAPLNLDAPNNPSLDTANQYDGVDSFSVFKSLVYKGTSFSKETPLVACKYSFSNKDIKDKFDVYGIHNSIQNNPDATNLDGDTADNLNKIILGGNKAYDSSYTEMPIFLMSTRSEYAFIKGYVADIYWIPSNLPTQTVEIEQPDTDGKKSKIIWRGWSMPWVSADEME